jgi:hypothetical protein
MEAHLRPPITKQLLHVEATQDGDATRVKHLTRKGDYVFSFDMHDGFYALGINPADRDYFTVNVRGQLYRLAGLPMGWSLSPSYLCKTTLTFVNFLRAPDL